MLQRSIFARSALASATAAMAFTALAAAPQLAMAQPYQPPASGPSQGDATYYDQCRRDRANREIAGGLIGGVAGALLGGNIGQGPGRTGGALLGGAAGAAVGIGAGRGSAACEPVPYADQGPPPPPQAAYDDRYAGPPDGPPAYRHERGDGCTMVEDRVFFPDGTVQRSSIRACRDAYGHWQVAD